MGQDAPLLRSGFAGLSRGLLWGSLLALNVTVALADPKAGPPKEEDFSDTPFTEYGEFNEEAEEAAETKFFQYGRFFGVGLGLGSQGALGNRGGLWQGGFPAVDLKVHYWFDFQLAMDLNIAVANQFYESTSLGHVDTTLLRLGLDLRYYFDTHNMSAPISAASPYLHGGIGNYSKTEYSHKQGTTDNDSAFGFSFGGGLEFAISPRKSYFQLEAKGHLVTFKDTYSTAYSGSPYSLPDLSGLIYTVTGSVMFTW